MKRIFIIYSSDGNIEKDIETKDLIKVLSFRDGGHFSFNKYSDIVNKEVAKTFIVSEINIFN